MSESCCCHQYPNLKFFNFETGEYYPFSCKTYKCEVCGPRKIVHLRTALTKWLRQFKVIRLWTFTISSKIFSDIVLHTKLLQMAWRYFITYVRRANALPKPVRWFQYVKFFEPHQSGFLHIHCFITEFLNWHIILAIWEQAVFSAAEKMNCDLKGKSCHVNVRGIFNASRAAAYVCKYVMKTVHEKSSQVKKLWSKSSNCTIFDTVEEKFLVGAGKFYLVRVHFSGNILNLYNNRVSPQVFQPNDNFFEDNAYTRGNFLELVEFFSSKEYHNSNFCTNMEQFELFQKSNFEKMNESVF